jgi:putative MFS transporter
MSHTAPRGGGTTQSTTTGRNGGAASVTARLDRIPVWPYERKLLWIVGAGYFFAFFDIVTISFAAPVIATQFHVSKGTVTLSVTSSLIGYIIGAFVDSTIADKWGRKLSLGISVAVFSIGTVLAAFSTNVVELIVFRFIAGLGIGAEIAAVTTYIGELSPARLRGRFTSWATTAAYAGFAVVPFIARGLVPTFASGWRMLFLIGALGGATIMFMRRGLPPSPRWLVSQGRTDEARELVAEAEETALEAIDGDRLPEPEPVPDEAPAERVPVKALLRPPMAGRVLLFVSIWFVYYIGNYGWLTLAPTLFTDKGYSLADSTTYLVVSGIGFLVGAFATTRFSDRIERKYAIALVAVAWAISLFVIGYFVSPAIIIVFGFVASLTIGLLVPMNTYTAEHFATSARATGVALSDGLGHIGGALAPLIVLGANSAWGFSSAFLVMGITGLVAGGLILFGIRATGRSLEAATA